jgi:transcription antitermination factor NusG
MEKWYVAHSKPRNEELLWKQFCLRSFESYYPCVPVQTMNSRTQRKQPYFPGYLFVHVDLEVTGRSVLEWIPGGTGLVSFGNEPAFISDGLVYAIKQQIDRLTLASDTPSVVLCKGDNVVVHGGVFAGYEGIFDVQLSGTDRVRVLLSLLNDQFIPVEMSAGYIHQAKQS